MINTLLVKKYDTPQLNKKEILRYMGCKESSAEVLALVEDCIDELAPKLTYKVCYRSFDIEVSTDIADLSFMTTNSKDLIKNLSDCKKIVLFAATIGLEPDRLIARYGRTSPSKALCFQAIGAERIESLCNAFNDEITKDCLAEGLFTRPRFSPGYGDFSLESQKSIFDVLDCNRKIGLSLNESLLMSPSKSVSALIGISSIKKDCHSGTCAQCEKFDCSFREE